jgi:hypothetical protein
MEAPSPTPYSRHIRAYGWQMTPRIVNSQVGTLHRAGFLKQGAHALTPSVVAAALPLGQVLVFCWPSLKHT